MIHMMGMIDSLAWTGSTKGRQIFMIYMMGKMGFCLEQDYFDLYDGHDGSLSWTESFWFIWWTWWVFVLNRIMLIYMMGMMGLCL